jgi:ABC-type transport system involved in multi-copper enzyme maturation permease subunit
LFVGPVFTREVVIAPRRTRLYVARTAYVGALLVLMCTAWLILAGTQVVRNVSDLARFGALLFQVLAVVQLVLAVSFSALFAASAVAQEKDRRTLILLLLTNLTNSELVLGKLFAGLLAVLVLIAASLPLFMLSVLFGGVGFDQIARAFAVMLASAVVCGSIGSTLALWRDSTYQTLALTVLVLVAWISGGEAVARGATGPDWHGVSTSVWAAGLSPWQAIQAAARPLLAADQALPYFGSAVNLFLALAAGLAVLTNGLSVLLVRVWNPSREARPRGDEAASQENSLESEGEAAPAWSSAKGRPAAGLTATRLAATDLTATNLTATGRGEPDTSTAARPSVHAAPGKNREVWDNPVLWREVRTWAYGRKVLIVHVAYLVLAGLAAWVLVSLADSPAGISRLSAALTLVPVFILSLLLVNAQAVTSVTNERDRGALDLLLVTDLSPREFVFGKLGGVFYNAKEMALIPILLCVYLWVEQALSTENLFFLVGGLVVMNLFVAMLGLHSGMNYDNSRSAIGVSLGTLFFLFVGIATCMRMMVAFSGSFHMQLQPFLAFMGGGALGLYLALGGRNPSQAILVTALACPAATFYAITSYLLGYTLGPFLVVLLTYGFAIAAMLRPALNEFDVATGRTSSGDE